MFLRGVVEKWTWISDCNNHVGQPCSFAGTDWEAQEMSSVRQCAARRERDGLMKMEC